MALKIRMSRAGAKKRPFYRIVVADGRMPRDGRFIEKIGTYNPLLPKDHADRLHLDLERAKHWLGLGAKPSDRIARFLDEAGLWQRRARTNPQKAQPKAKAQARLAEAAEAAEAAEQAAEQAASAEAEAAESGEAVTAEVETTEAEATEAVVAEAAPEEPSTAEEPPAEAEPSAEEDPPAPEPSAEEAQEEPPASDDAEESGDDADTKDG